jgi:hypothetical protein
MQSGGFGVQMVQLLRTLKLGVTADLVDFATSDKPAPSLHVLASLGDDLFGTGRFHTFNRFQEAFRYAVGIHGFKLKDDKVSLQSDGHFDYLGVNFVNGRPCLDEMKLLSSMLIPELYSTSMY